MNEIGPGMLPHLTWSDLRDNYPVANADRRKLVPLLEEELGDRDYRDDEVFYSAYLSCLRGQGVLFLLTCDAELMRGGREKHKKKTFFVRTLERLRMDSPDSDVLEDFDLFPPGSVEAQLQDILAACLSFKSPDAPPMADSPDPNEPGSETADDEEWWSESVERVKSLALRLQEPDGALVADLESAIQRLRKVCDAEEERLAAENAAAWEERRAAFRDALVALDFDGAAALREEIETCSAEDLERAAEPLEAIRGDVGRLRTSRGVIEEISAKIHSASLKEKRRYHARLGEVIGEEAELEDHLQAQMAEALSLLCGLSPRHPDAGGELPVAEPAPETKAAVPVVPEPNELEDSTGERQGASTAEGREAADTIPHLDPTPTVDADGATEDGVSPPTTDPERGAESSDPAEGPLEPKVSGTTAETSNPEPALPRHESGEEAPPSPIHKPADPEAGATPTPASADVSERLAALLNAGEVELACHLTALTEARGLELPLPSSALQAVIAGRCPNSAWDPASIEATSIFANAMEDYPAGDGPAEGLLFAAMARSAVVAHNTNARTHLRNLSLDAFPALKPLQSALYELGFSFDPTINDLLARAGKPSVSQVETATNALRSWLHEARAYQSKHQPTTAAFQHLISPSGELGRVMEAALHGERGAVTAADDLLGKFENNPEAIEAMVHAVEREMGRPARDRIFGNALDWIKRKIGDGLGQLRNWKSARQADSDRQDGRRAAAMAREIGALLKSCDEALAHIPDADGHDLFSAVAGVVRKSVHDLKDLLGGRVPSEAPSVRTALFDSTLGLPAGCQPMTPDPVRHDDPFATERQAQQDLMFAALLGPELLPLPDRMAAFRARLSERALAPAQRLFELIRQSGDVEEARLTALRADMEEARRAAAGEVIERATVLERSLIRLGSLDLEHEERVRSAIGRVSALVRAVKQEDFPALPEDRLAGVPADFPAARKLLSEGDGLERELRESIIEGQRKELLSLAERPELRGEVQKLLETLEGRDPNSVADMIASLRAGKPVLRLEPDGGNSFDRFFPTFAEQVANDAVPAASAILRSLKHEEAVPHFETDRLDKDQRAGMQQVIRRWNDLRSCLNHPVRLAEAVRQLLEECGFTGVKVEGENAVISRGLMRFDMRSDVPRPTGWFLPPGWGSLAGGAYRIYVCRPETAEDQILAEFVKAQEDAPKLLLFLGRMSGTRRREFAHKVRNSRQKVLLLDEALLLFLAQAAEARLATLFECGLPFGYLQPYTTDPGEVPNEMFFGRREEIDKIARRGADGCLVYGGRQLGKSALLYQVRSLHHHPSEGFIVHYRDCNWIGSSGNPAARIWREIARDLEQFGITQSRRSSADEVTQSVRAWLGGAPTRRILLLLDETDSFMSAEARTGFVNLIKLKELMETTGRRFKVVFAGLHNVRRALKAPNSPLAHLGDPICVGPLNNTSDDMAEARRLVVEPMRAAGFDYSEPGLGHDILVKVNHYPSLVQVYCKELLTELYRKPTPPGSGPRWQITRNDVEGGGGREISESIREKFRLTLRLDPRYELIANVLAHHRFEDDDAVLRRGLNVPELQQRIEDFWPENLQWMDRAALVGLLDEMVDLGVLALLDRRRGRYGLRTAHVAQMLGQKSEIEDVLEQLMALEPRVDYDAALYVRPVDPGTPSVRSPFTDQQLESLFGERPKAPRIAAGSALLGMADAVDALARLARDWHDEESPACEVDVIKVRKNRKPETEFRSRLEQRRHRPTVLLVPPQSGWDHKWVNFAAGSGPVQAGEVRPIFVADQDWLRERYIRHGRLPEHPVITPRPWGHQTLRAFLDETDQTSLDTLEIRRALLEASGGAFRLLLPLCQALGELPAGSPELYERIRQSREDNLPSLETVGLSPAFAEPALLLLEAYSPHDVPTLRELWDAMDARSPVDLGICVMLFARLGLVEPLGLAEHGVRPTELGRLVRYSLVKEQAQAA